MRFHLTKKSIILSVLLAVFMLFAVACGKSPTQQIESTEEDTESVTFSQTTLELTLGETATLTATVNPEGGTVLWNVSNGDSVITFDTETGLITAVCVGEAIVTAQIGYSRAECKVTVTQNVVEEYSVSLNRESTQITVGQQINLLATIRLGSNVISDADIVWSVAEGDAVSVTQDGVVTAEKEGVAIVRATYMADDGSSATADCTFGVLPKPANYMVYPDGKGSSARYAMKNETFTLTPQVFDADNNLVSVSYDELFITSECPEVVQYLGDGRFRTLQTGKSSIRVEYKDVDGYYDVEVVDFVITANMMENVREGWTGAVTSREDGKLIYQADVWTGAVVFTDPAFAQIKQAAEEYGYTKLVATMYSINNNCLLNVFGEGAYQTTSGNMQGTYIPFTESEVPLRYEIDYATFKDWETMQVFLSNGWDAYKAKAIFTLTLEKYTITAEEQMAMVGSTIHFADFNVKITDAAGEVDNLTYEDFKITSLNPEVVAYENGVFTAKETGSATICIEYGGTAIYVNVMVSSEVFNLTSNMIESIGISTNWDWGGYISDVREDGKMVYTSQHIYANGIALTDAAFAQIKKMAEKYGYSKLVVTIYSVDVANIHNIFNNQKVIGGTNVQGAYTAFTEDDAPFRCEIDYATFKDWTAMQIFYSEGEIMNALFTLALEKYDVAVEEQIAMVGSTIHFSDLHVTVTDTMSAVENLTYTDFTVTSFNPEIVTYEDGVFTAKALGTAKVCIEYKGCKSYFNVTVSSDVYNLTSNMIESVGASTNWDWGGYISDVREDGKMVYTSQHIYANGIALTDAAFEQIKKMAEKYGYSKLVVTIYSVDVANIHNIFNNQKNIGGSNVQGAYTSFMESGIPFRYEIDYAAFKDWAAMQIFYSEGAIMNAVFTLTLEKYDVAAKDQMPIIDTTFDFAELQVKVTDATGTIENLTYADFTVTSLNPEVVAYEDGVFTAKALGTAKVCIDYKGCKTYINVTVETGDEPYVVPFSMYSTSTNPYHSAGAHVDGGDGMVQVIQHPWDGGYVVEITGDNWATLKALAEKRGYTKLVLTIHGATSKMVLGATDLTTALPTLGYNLNGSYANNWADFANQEKLVVLVAACGAEIGSAESVTFSLTFEKYEVTAEAQTVIVDTTFDFTELQVKVTDATGTIENLTYADFTVTSLNPKVVTYENGMFTAVAEGTATICIEYKGCKTYINVTAESGDEPYVVPFSMYSTSKNPYHSAGAHVDGGDGKVQVIQHPWNGGYVVEITGDNWATLKALAEKRGYTKLVLTIHYVTPSMVLGATDLGTTLPTLGYNLSGIYANNWADFANQEKLVVLVAACGTEIGSAESVVFSLSLEKYEVTAEAQTVVVDSTFNFAALNVAVTDEKGAMEGLTYTDFMVMSLNPEVVTYKNGVFTAKAEGPATICIDYKGSKTYVQVTVLGASYALTADMIESVGVSTSWSWGGYISNVREDGKMVYTSQHVYANGIALTDAAFARVKEMAETYGYNKLVVTIYSVDVANIYNIFNSQKAIGGANVQGQYAAFTENDKPFQVAIDYATFKDWTAMQIFCSEGAILNALFTLTLEKYQVTAQDQMTTVGSTFNFANLNVAVTDENGAIANLTYADFTITSLTPEVLAYENGVFTAKAEGKAIICIDYKGCKTYAQATVLGASYALTADMIESVGVSTGWSWGGYISDVREDGKMVYTSQHVYANGIALTDAAFARVKEMAETYGYSKLVVTIYSIDAANIYNIFNNQKNIGGTNVQGKYTAFTEGDAPFRYEIDYATFKDWAAMQILYSEDALLNALFTLTLEK